MIHRYRHIWSTILSLGILLGAPLSALHASKPALVRSTINKSGAVWVGEQVPFYITLMTTHRFTGSPRFDLPEISGALLLKVPDRPTLGTETVSGESYVRQMHEFALFAQRRGMYVIPPFEVRFASVGLPGTQAVEHRLTTGEMRIEAKMPPGAENLSTIISTTELSVREAWHPKPGPAKVGDAFTRKITFRAPNVMGMAFPPLSMENVAGLGVYPKEPVVRDYTQRGEFTGERTETITYVCEREGTSTLPGLVIQWWDLKNEKLRRVELQPVTFEVAPNPALTPEAEPAPLPSQSTGFPWWVLGVAVLVVIGAILLTKYRHALVLRWKERQARLAESEAAYFKRFRSASRSGNLSQIMQTLLSWLDRCIFSGQTASLEDFVLQTDDPKLAEQIENLESMLYGRSRALDLQESWSGKRFYKAVSRARRRLGRSATSFQPKPRGLPDLNPQSW